MPSSPTPERFSARLLAWWDEAGRKDLPWQQPRSAYRVWVSEIMLQQTQVSAVIPYFDRWMARFRDVRSLAEADPDEVMSLWSGLGYYARARNLHKAARICMSRHGGILPGDPEELQALPGIGPSTANAIVSLAFDRPAAVLDGNVKRVLARHAGIEGWPGTSGIQKILWKEAEARLPKQRAGDYSQAIMDLGATLCTRQAPACRECPVQADCRANLFGLTNQIPAPRPKKPVPNRSVHMLILRDQQGRVLLQRRPPDGIWGGLWSLPEGESSRQVRDRVGLDHRAEGAGERRLPEFEHRLTHVRMQISPVLMTLPPDAALECDSIKEGPETAWFSPQEFRGIGLPKPVNELLQKIESP